MKKRIHTLFATVLLCCVFVVCTAPYTAQAETLEYQIKYHASEPEQPKPVLLTFSLPSGQDEVDLYQQLKVLEQILESHWRLSIDIVEYTDVSINEAQAYPYIIFVELFNEEASIQHFKNIYDQSDATVFWIGYGTERLTGQKQQIQTNAIDHITYKNVPFTTGGFLDVVGSLPTEDDSLEILATYTSSETDTELPFAAKLDDRHILAPFTLPSYYSTENYSVPFLDLFHQVFGHHTSDLKPGLLRLEDVNTHTYHSGHTLRPVYKYLKHEQIPFHIAFIERYINPEENIDVPSTNSIRFINTIKQMVHRGDAVLIQHGYTHQVGNEISGAGFEFWDAEHNRPLQFESTEAEIAYVQGKIDDAQRAMKEAGLPVPNIWETPHYAEGPLTTKVINANYQIRYSHIPKVGSLPFVAKIDNVIYIPENIGYIIDGIEQFEEKDRLLSQLNTFEDPVASIFWHPWRDREELELIKYFFELHGHTFVSAYSLLEEGAAHDTEIASYSIMGVILHDTTLYFIFLSFVLGALLYMRNVYLVRKYVKQIGDYTINMGAVYQAALEAKQPVPEIALFVPARNEGLVIGNTIRRIANLEYPKERLTAYIIVDERELDDDVPRTTRDVAAEAAAVAHKEQGIEFVKIIEVPKWYSGEYGSMEATYARSTKGRALNYCLQTIDTSTIDMIGILDADGRLHPNVLKEVAYKRIKNKSKVLQGPVLQVGNFKDVSIVGRAAGLELALHHLTELPARLNEHQALQFLAGTNYFIDATCIANVGGWDQHALVEDAEIALRLYLKEGVVGDWLNSPEIEQTPANLRIYLKQRERWVRGHIELLSQIKQAGLPFRERVRVYNKVIFSQFRFLFDIGLPIVSIYFMIAGAYSYIDPIFAYVSIVLMIASVFIWDTYGFMYRTLKQYIDPNMTLRHQATRSFQHLIFLPIFILIQAAPRMLAMYNYTFRRHQQSWYKTERTAETVTN